jgi:hypothetical protein
MSAPRHPLAVVFAVAVLAAAAAVAVFFLVVLPLLNAINAVPSDLIQWNANYDNGVYQQLQQARQQHGGGTP